MRREHMIIPAAFQLVLDDIGWFKGDDDRWDDMPSRTGIPRDHVLEDYIAVNEIGRQANMKINVMFAIGEWDVNNRIRKLPNSSRFGANWDSSPYINLELAEKARDYLNSCEYIEQGIHCLLHEVWDDEGKLVGGQEFFLPEGFIKGAPRHLAPESYIRAHLDTFMEIYRDWGFTQELRAFASPSGAGDSWKNDDFASVLKDYVKYWHNYSFDHSRVRCGVIMTKSAAMLAPWNAYDLDPRKLKIYSAEEAGIIAGHWPNLLRFDPENNLERLADWKDYFDRQAEVFGVVMSRDVAFAHHQQLYRYYSKVEEENGMIKLDLTEPDKLDPYEEKHPIYISFKNGSEPTECIGGNMSLYETKKEFKTYKIERTEENIIYIK